MEYHMSQEELAELAVIHAEHQKQATEQMRRNAYQQESDPLFFKAQRGEATFEEWQAKVAEIKIRFPKPTE